MARQDAGMTRLDEVIYEFRRVGAYVKVSAVDPESMTEVSIVGDPGAGQELLERIALNKLIHVMAKRGRFVRGSARGGRWA